MSSVNFIFNLKKLKYDKLDEVLSDLLTEKTVNIVFDIDTLFDIFRVEFYKTLVEKIPSHEGSLAIVAEFFNFISHYRHYFLDKKGIRPIFFFIFNSKNDRIREEIYPDIWDKKINKTERYVFLQFCFKKFKSVSHYLKDIHVLDGLDLHYTLIPQVLIDTFPNFTKTQTFLLHENGFYSQYLGFLHNKSCILNVNSSSYGIVKYGDYFPRFIERNKYKKFEDGELSIPDDLIPLHMAVSEFEGMSKLVKTNRATSKLCLDFFNGTELDELIPDQDNLEEVIKRLDVLDVTVMRDKISDYDITQITAQYNTGTRVSNSAIFKLNNQYFGNQINLNWLCEREDDDGY